MELELTLSDIYEDIADRLASARTRALMGERQEALGIFQGASLDFTRFREVLQGYPGYYALENAFTFTLKALCEEQAEPLRLSEAAEMEPAVKTRRKIRKAA